MLLERTVHFILDKYRKASRREWFQCLFDIVKKAIYYAKCVLESDIDFANINLQEMLSNKSYINIPLLADTYQQKEQM